MLAAVPGRRSGWALRDIKRRVSQRLPQRLPQDVEKREKQWSPSPRWRESLKVLRDSCMAVDGPVWALISSSTFMVPEGAGEKGEEGGEGRMSHDQLIQEHSLRSGLTAGS